jgi:hypothetical protein
MDIPIAGLIIVGAGVLAILALETWTILSRLGSSRSARDAGFQPDSRPWTI